MNHALGRFLGYKTYSKLWPITYLAIFLCHSSPAQAEPKFSWGSIARVRYEYWKNIRDMNSSLEDNRNFFPVKTSVWGQADLDNTTGLYAKLTNEFKGYTYFGGTASPNPDKTASKKGYHFDIHEVIFENLYLEKKNVLDGPVDLKLGRQDLADKYGEGFLIKEGTPQDGPRTLYFNAAKAVWRVDEKNTVDLIYINDPRDEEFLPAINRSRLDVASDPSLDDQPQNLNTTDEQAAVVYWSNKSIQDLVLEPYYIFKNESKEGGVGYQAQQSELHTFGGFAKYASGPLALRGQIAHQSGDYGSTDRNGLGGYAFADYTFKDIPWAPKPGVGFVYLSGDDKGTAKNEGWNPLFSRWEWLSPMYARSNATETGIAGYWTNLKLYRAGVSCKLTEKVELTFNYNLLQANEEAAPGSILSGHGKDRGDLYQIKIDCALSKQVTSFFWAEWLEPGDFYRENDTAFFLRAELQFKF